MTSPKMWSDGHSFENEVRRIARALWNYPAGDGAAQFTDGHERDIIFETEDVIHYLECTRKRTLDKIRRDISKMVKYRDKNMRRGRLVKLWYVTENEPTGDQRTEASKHSVDIVSISQFESKLLDVGEYLELRKKYRFGSASDPDTDSHDLSSTTYQPSKIRNDTSQSDFTVENISDSLSKGSHIALLGDYGMGKSLTLHQVFLHLRALKASGRISSTPVLLNLRDHWGQDNPSEALSRHARHIGFTKPQQLVRALNAGKLIIMLDGFDETASVQWSPREASRMRDARRLATSLAKSFADMQRSRCGFIVAGRDHFFDSYTEMESALGLSRDHIRLTLDGFSINEMKAYLGKRGFKTDLPDWLPNRPLLLGYLSRENLLQKVLSDTEASSPSLAWDSMLDKICEREANIHKYLGKESIRSILEKIASRARETVSGVGPITEKDIFDSFREVVEMDPDETAKPLLMRLPGLSAKNRTEGGREFLDDSMLDVLRAGDIVRFAKDPYSDPGASQWKHSSGMVCSEIVIQRVESLDEKRAGGRLLAASAEAAKRWKSSALAFDLIQSSRQLLEGATVPFNDIAISGITISHLDLTESPVPTDMTLTDVIITDFQCPQKGSIGPTITHSIFERIFGHYDKTSLPSWVTDCDTMEFDGAGTNAQILREGQLAIGIRVATTMLRKLFVQRGHGRKENALLRGMSPAAQEKAKMVLPLLQSESLAFPVSHRGSTLWHPIPGQRPRVKRMLQDPGKSDDSFFRRAAEA